MAQITPPAIAGADRLLLNCTPEPLKVPNAAENNANTPKWETLKRAPEPTLFAGTSVLFWVREQPLHTERLAHPGLRLERCVGR